VVAGQQRFLVRERVIVELTVPMSADSQVPDGAGAGVVDGATARYGPPGDDGRGPLPPGYGFVAFGEGVGQFLNLKLADLALLSELCLGDGDLGGLLAPGGRGRL